MARSIRVTADRAHVRVLARRPRRILASRRCRSSTDCSLVSQESGYAEAANGILSLEPQTESDDMGPEPLAVRRLPGSQRRRHPAPLHTPRRAGRHLLPRLGIATRILRAVASRRRVGRLRVPRPLALKRCGEYSQAPLGVVAPPGCVAPRKNRGLRVTRRVEMAPGGVEPPHADSKPEGLNLDLRGKPGRYEGGAPLCAPFPGRPTEILDVRGNRKPCSLESAVATREPGGLTPASVGRQGRPWPFPGPRTLDKLCERVRILKACARIEAGGPEELSVALHAPVYPPSPDVQTMTAASDLNSRHSHVFCRFRPALSHLSSTRAHATTVTPSPTRSLSTEAGTSARRGHLRLLW